MKNIEQGKYLLLHSHSEQSIFLYKLTIINNRCKRLELHVIELQKNNITIPNPLSFYCIVSRYLQ